MGLCTLAVHVRIYRVDRACTLEGREKDDIQYRPVQKKHLCKKARLRFFKIKKFGLRK